MILAKYPGLTDDQMREAHSYAYGGAVIQDMGYYPFGNQEFSDLVHYVRSGDFVMELIKESKTADEYAFALGALSHYASDITGHPAVNQAVSSPIPSFAPNSAPSFSTRRTRRHTFGRNSDLIWRRWQRALRPRAVSRLHRFRGIQRTSGTRIPRRVRCAVEGCAIPRRPGHWLVPLSP